MSLADKIEGECKLLLTGSWNDAVTRSIKQIMEYAKELRSQESVKRDSVLEEARQVVRAEQSTWKADDVRGALENVMNAILDLKRQSAPHEVDSEAVALLRLWAKRLEYSDPHGDYPTVAAVLQRLRDL